MNGGDTSTRTKSDAPPQQRFKLTDEVKNMIWQLVTINNEMAAMTNVMQYVHDPFVFPRDDVDVDL